MSSQSLLLKASARGRSAACCSLRAAAAAGKQESSSRLLKSSTSLSKRSYFNGSCSGSGCGGGYYYSSSSGFSSSSSSSSSSSYSSFFRKLKPGVNTNTTIRGYGGSGNYSYEYPLATEPPEITRTTAEEAKMKGDNKEKGVPKGVSEDPFDDSHTLSKEEREDILKAQDQYFRSLTPSSTISEITAEVPSRIPPNVPASQLKAPETLITDLDNGIRVVSQETYGQVSTVGAVCSLGSRLETNDNSGVTNLLEALAFGTTSSRTALDITNLLQDWGGTRFCNTGREQSLYCIDLLRPNAHLAMNLLAEVLLESVYPPDEVFEAKRALDFQAMDLPPELLLSEGLQAAAFGKEQQLGRPHFCLQHDQVEHLTPELCHRFWQSQVVTNPSGLVIAGAGVKHDFIVESANEHFGHLTQTQDGSRVHVQPSAYRGGQESVVFPTADGLTRVAVALPTGGWDSQDLVTTCVLQTLLGGGNSFSAGGPGKGMYSRLYRQVLNRYSWAESAEAFTAFYQESGMWGISGHTVPHKVRDMVQVFCEHLLRLANEPVAEEELSRARNMLKCNVLTQLESRIVLFEDLARQVLTYGKREDMHTTCLKIDAVTADNLMELAQKSLAAAPPTIASVGNDLSHVPSHQEVSEWLCYEDNE